MLPEFYILITFFNFLKIFKEFFESIFLNFSLIYTFTFYFQINVLKNFLTIKCCNEKKFSAELPNDVDVETLTVFFYSNGDLIIWGNKKQENQL